MSKTQRQYLLTKMLTNDLVTNQEQLVVLLAEAGIVATQATVSRDLGDLGAIKIRVAGGESVYAIPEQPADRLAPESHLPRVMGEWVADIGHSGNIAVLHTPPGSAHVVASAIDRAGYEEILGTVAGDDTILVVAAGEFTGKCLARKFQALIDG